MVLKQTEKEKKWTNIIGKEEVSFLSIKNCMACNGAELRFS